jgi:Ca2+-binding EF-hand superfamily protein
MAAMALALTSACNGKMATPVAGAMLPAAPQTSAQSVAGMANAFKSLYNDQFRRFDSNQDGHLSPQEYASPQFQGLDRDHDGRISLNEYVTTLTKASAATRAAMRRMATDTIQRFDLDRDGLLSFLEYRTIFSGRDTATQQRYIWAFKASDKYNDNRLSPSELEDLIAWDYTMSDLLSHPVPAPIATPSPAQPQPPGPISSGAPYQPAPYPISSGAPYQPAPPTVSSAPGMPLPPPTMTAP